MKKVKLTREQADAIEEYKERTTGVFDFLHDLRLYNLIPNHADIEKEQDEMIKMMSAYVNGYEVKPKFEVGDWVVCTDVIDDNYKSIAKITKVEGERIYGFWSNSKKERFNYDFLCRHATPEEIAEEKENIS